METQLREATAQIVASYLSRNQTAPTELTPLIESVMLALRRLVEPPPEPEPLPEPAVPVRRSVTPDHLVCLECGQKVKMLRRHIETRHGIEPQEYRARWSLPYDYPMTAPNYARLRSEMAVTGGLGSRNRAKADADCGAAVAAPEAPPPAEPAPKSRPKPKTRAKPEAGTKSDGAGSGKANVVPINGR